MTEDQARMLARALQEQFGGEVDFEPTNGRGRYRFAITSAYFDKLAHLKRQDEVWAVVDRILPREAAIDVSLILAFSPADLTAIG